jgi:hypothetical protein
MRTKKRRAKERNNRLRGRIKKQARETQNEKIKTSGGDREKLMQKSRKKSKEK